MLVIVLRFMISLNRGMLQESVEVLQYFRLVETLRLQDNTFLTVLIGSVFDSKYIICYGIGCAAIALVAGIRKKVKQ